MDVFLKFFFAIVAALNAATGAPLDGADMPDRPAITIPTLAPLPIVSPMATMPTKEPAKTTAISGTITNIQDGFIFVSGIPVSLGPDTQVNGQLRAGSFVQVEAKVRADGGLEADKLEVSDDSTAPRPTLGPTEQPQAQTVDQPAVKPTVTQEVKPVMSPEVQPTEKPEAQPTEKPEAQRTERPEVKPAAQPAGQSTENPEVKPSDQPEVLATGRPNGDSGNSSKSGGSGQTGGTDAGKSGNPGTNGNASKSGGDNGPGD